MDHLKSGAVIGDYKIEEEIAQGGMGAVFRARHVDLDRVVAIKVLNKEFSRHPEIIKRFLREGKLIAKMDHPGIIKIFDLGQEGDSYYLVMEYIDGKDIQQELADRGPFTSGRALEIIKKVADALDYSHSRGVVHRDVKPSNILLARDGSIRLMDFGIARLVGQDTHLTQAGSIIGTPVYMSPEQCRGHNVDARSDLYSLGATLYIMLSGEPPFKSKNPARLIGQIMNENPPPLESIVGNLSISVANFVKRLMAKHPGARYQTGRELSAAIDDIFQRRLTFAQEPQELERDFSGAGDQLIKALFALVAISALGMSIYFLSLKTDSPSVLASSGMDRGTGGSKAGAEPIVRKRHVGPVGRTDPAKQKKPKLRGAKKAPSRYVLKNLLEKRIRGFGRTLLLRKREESLTFVEPRLRNSPSLIFSLGRISQMVESLGEDPIAEHTLAMSREKADVVYEFSSKDSPQRVTMPVTWIYRDGEWFLLPQDAPVPR